MEAFLNIVSSFFQRNNKKIWLHGKGALYLELSAQWQRDNKNLNEYKV